MLYLELDFNTHIGITTTVRNVKAKVFGMLGVTAKVRASWHGKGSRKRRH